tara:strand:+ start:2675 stop:3571 length:897 start_codon:yes stop_codon:yes gene_type:complete
MLSFCLAVASDAGVSVGVGRGDLPMARMHHPSGATAEVYLQGAHVTSWRPADGEERLFVSSASLFEAGAAIRGGIPICFPQFAGRGPLSKHGFARTSDEWEIESTTSDDEAVCLVLCLSDSAATRAVWPHHFRLRYIVKLSEAELSTDIELTNSGSEPFEFTAALHTYFATPDVEHASIMGLAGLSYEDNAAGGALAVEQAEEVRLAAEVDRAYLDAPGSLTIRHDGAPIELTKRGFRDVVLWNLGADKASSMSDLGPGEWRRYVCLETGAVGSPVRLDGGDVFRAGQTFGLACAPEL